MLRFRTLPVLGVIAFLLVTAACGQSALAQTSPTPATGTPTAEPTETATPTATATPSPTAEPTQYPYRVFVPSLTRSETATPTPSPTPPPTGDGLWEYTVQPGETLASIAIDQGTAASTLVSLNGIPRNAELTPGQVLLIMKSPPGELPCNDILVPANRQHALGEFCAPAALSTLATQYVVTSPQQLTPEAASALVQMLDAARDAGFDLYVSSSYRSWQEQEALFQYWVDLLGLERASRESARAGYSEHQIGTTADITGPAVDWQLDPSFGDTPEGIWLAEHAADYGFAMSYPEDGEPVTGYIYEPWHFRYVGTDIAHEVEESGKTLIEVLMYHWALDHPDGG